MKKYFVVVALFCSLIFAGCSKENNPLTTYKINDHDIDMTSVIGIISFNYVQNDYYTSKDFDDIAKEYHGDSYYEVATTFYGPDRKYLTDEEKIAINTHKLREGNNICNITEGTNPEFDVYWGYGKTNTIEKEASDYFPAFTHEVGFGKPVKFINFTPNQTFLIKKNEDIILKVEGSTNELTEYKLKLFSYFSNEEQKHYQTFNHHHTLYFGNIKSILLTPFLMGRYRGVISHIIITKTEMKLVPVEVNRDKFKEDKQYKVLYIARSSYRSSFFVK